MPALGSRQPLGIQLMAYSGKRESISGLFSNEITAASIAGFLADFGDLQTAVDAVTLGTMSENSWGEKTVLSNTRPASKNAQLESSMLVLCQGATTEAPHSFRIPTIDFTKLNFIPEAGDAVYMSGASASTELAAWTAAFEAIGRSPRSDANAIEVLGGRYVGRPT